MDNNNRFFVRALCIMSFVCAAVFPVAQAYAADCMTMGWRRGKPFNYYGAETRESTGTYRGGLLYLVESAHFTKKVRRLIEGKTSKQPGDLLFVLGSIPNHPAALDAYARYEHQWQNSPSFRQRLDTDEPPYDAGCFFARAAKIYPNDASTYLTWGIYFYRKNDYQQALERFLAAYAISPNSAEVNYNVGLAYVDVGNVEKAKEFAVRAYQLGYPLQGLKNKIAEFEASNK
ncbi:tetratricopeptide repeat protein [Aliiglaciecola litoralis]|uniref:Tetratricopeptide repeat protein n=1 Tax=Aliiglaciecola litoralis TaxID=582857 RepID=A0ABP3WUN3_9ALTE